MPLTGAPLAAFLTRVLTDLTLPVTEWTLEFMTEWAGWENTNAINNPLATTRILNRGETVFNSHGVRNYATVEDGIYATVSTIRLRYYTVIVQTLQEQRIDDRERLAAQLFTPGVASWGTSGFAALIRNGWNPASTVIGSKAENVDAQIAALRDELARVNEGIHRRFDWIAYGASQAEQPNFPPAAPPRVDWNG